MNQQQFENFTASSLYCENAKKRCPSASGCFSPADREIFDISAPGAESSVGRREITAGEN